jgi:hypothetical protein
MYINIKLICKNNNLLLKYPIWKKVLDNKRNARRDISWRLDNRINKEIEACMS